MLFRELARLLSLQMHDQQWNHYLSLCYSFYNDLDCTLYLQFDSHTYSIPSYELTQSLDYISQKYLMPIAIQYWLRHTDPALLACMSA